MKQTMSRFFKMLPWLVLALSLAFSLFLYARYGENTLDSDQSSDFVQASHLNQKGALLSKEWFYSTELATVSPIPIYQLGLLLFRSWHHARIFSIMIIAAATIVSFLYAARQIGCREEAIYCAACFILPFSKVHSFLFSWGGFYSMYLILCCISLGLLLSIGRPTYRWIKFLLLIIIGVLLGTAGVRVFMFFSIPFVIAALLTRAQTAPASLCEYPQTFWFPIASVLFFFSNFIGYLINLLVLSPMYHFRQYGSLITKSFQVSEFFKHIDALVSYLGFHDNSTLLSLDGGIGFLLIILAFATIIVPIVLILNPSLSPVKKIVPWFALSASLFLWIIDSMAVGYSATPYAVGYYMMGILFALLSIFMLIQQLNFSVFLRTLIMLAVTVLFGLNTVSYVQHDIPGHELQQAKAATWLTENGYTQGYATFWNGNLLTELSDGKLDVVLYASWKSRKPYEWMQTIQHVNAPLEGKAFLYTDIDEIANYPSPCMSEDLLVYSDGNVRIYAFDDGQTVYLKQLNQYAEPTP